MNKTMLPPIKKTKLKATIQPSVLIWSRESSGFSIEKVAKKINIDSRKLLAWEEARDQPSIPQLRKLADVYKRPLAFFYLSQPPSNFQARLPITIKNWLLSIINVEKLNFFNLKPEEQLSVRLFREVMGLIIEGELDVIMLHVPNEGKRSFHRARVLKAMGMVPGSPDYIIIGKNKTLFLELKVNKADLKLKDNQELFRQWAMHLGVAHAVVNSVEDGIKAIESVFCD